MDFSASSLGGLGSASNSACSRDRSFSDRVLNHLAALTAFGERIVEILVLEDRVVVDVLPAHCDPELQPLRHVLFRSADMDAEAIAEADAARLEEELGEDDEFVPVLIADTGAAVIAWAEEAGAISIEAHWQA